MTLHPLRHLLRTLNSHPLTPSEVEGLFFENKDGASTSSAQTDFVLVKNVWAASLRKSKWLKLPPHLSRICAIAPALA